MSEIAIKAENLGKAYSIGASKSSELRYSLGNKIKSFFNPDAAAKEEFWALRDLNFEIKKGEAVGIIGRNGAGKSTLLKILSRITDPTTGRFEINGRVSSLLEVGTGFHMELSGRENIFLNGTILGMKRSEIRSKFDEIVDFSGIEKFIDTPVKHYSSGMKVRLAFSVAAHLEPEILIVDEVLAVGDAEFQKKCLGKMDSVSKEGGRTVIFVSHNMGAVQNLCQVGILLENGVIKSFSDIGKIVDLYLQKESNNEGLAQRTDRKGGDIVRLIDFYVANNSKKILELISGSSYEFNCVINSKSDIKGLKVRILFTDSVGSVRFLCNNSFSGELFNFHKGENVVKCTIPDFPLPKGHYDIRVTIADSSEFLDDIEDVASVEVLADNFFNTGKEQVSNQGVLVKHYFNHEKKD